MLLGDGGWKGCSIMQHRTWNRHRRHAKPRAAARAGSPTTPEDRLPRIALLLVCLLCSFSAPATAVAQEAPVEDREPAATDDRADDPDWALSVGGFDVIDGQSAFELGIERRFDRFRLLKLSLIPVAGVTVTSDGGFYVAGGARLDHPLGDRWVVSPHFAVTLLEQGDGRDLGSVVEFRSGLEIAYLLPNRRRLGLSFYHLSNAGIDKTNPGSESLVFVYSF